MDANLVTVSFTHFRRSLTLLGTPRPEVHLGPRNPKIQSRCRTRALLIVLLNLIGHLRPIFSLQWLVDSTLSAVSMLRRDTGAPPAGPGRGPQGLTRAARKLIAQEPERAERCARLESVPGIGETRARPQPTPLACDRGKHGAQG